MRTLLPILAVVLSSCGEITAPVRDTSRLIQTYDLTYRLETEGSTKGFRLSYSYSNPLQDTLYIPNCSRSFGFVLEKRHAAKWVASWAPIIDACLSQPIVIAPGASYRAEFHVSGAKAGSNTYPQFPAGDLDGVYRLRITRVVKHYDPNTRGFGEPVSDDLLISNEFSLVDP